MMNDLPRLKLCELITRYGQVLCDEPGRCEGLLRDLCAKHRGEVNVLMTALKERVATDLLNTSITSPIELLISRLIKRLQDHQGMTDETARWAVESWALALAKISEAELSKPSSGPQAPPPLPNIESLCPPSSSLDHSQPQQTDCQTNFSSSNLDRGKVRARVVSSVFLAACAVAAFVFWINQSDSRNKGHNREQTREEKLWATARANDSPEKAQIALAALDELVELIPNNPEATLLRMKILRYAGPLTLIVPTQYPTIHEALDLAQSGDTVTVGAGVYKEILSFKDGIRLVGEGVDRVIIRCAGEKAPVLTVVNCKSGFVSGISFEHAGSVSGDMSYPAVELISSSIEIYRCTVKNAASYGVRVSASGVSTIRECLIQGNSFEGIFVTDTETNPVLKDNICLSNGSAGICFTGGSGGTAEGNTCEKNTTCGIHVKNTGTAPTLTKNRCQTNKLNGIYYSDGAAGIAEDNICVENMWSGICITNPGTAPTLMKNVCRTNESAGIYFIGGAGGTAEGNTCEKNTTFGIYVKDAGTAPTLTKNRCQTNKQNGIYYSDGAAGIAEDNICVENMWSGICLTSPGTAPTLMKNVCRTNESAGIFFTGGAGGTVEGNTCEKNTSCGIYVQDTGTAPTLMKNVCRANKLDGIFFTGGAGGIAEGNTCEKNTNCGIYLQDTGTAPTLMKNVCRTNESAGIFFTKGARGTAEGNTCEENKLQGIGVSGKDTAPRLLRNRCNNNAQYGIAVATESIPAAFEGNTASGNGNKYGDINRAVDFIK